MAADMVPQAPKKEHRPKVLCFVCHEPVKSSVGSVKLSGGWVHRHPCLAQVQRP